MSEREMILMGTVTALGPFVLVWSIWAAVTLLWRPKKRQPKSILRVADDDLYPYQIR
jgi:hypothetical protein